MEMRITFVIMEDDAHVRQLLLKYFDQFANFECLGCFETATAAHDFIMQTPVHLLIADILLPDMDGMDMVASLPTPPLVVFMTAYNSKKKATKGHALNAVHYLTKPISFSDFQEAIERVVDRLSGKPDREKSFADAIFLGGERNKQRIILAEVIYIEVIRNYSVVHLISGKSLRIRMPLRKVLNQLPPNMFMQVHRSFIIATAYFLRKRYLTLQLYNTDQDVPLGRNFVPALQARFPEVDNADTAPTAQD